jgi:hypothetical protein
MDSAHDVENAVDKKARKRDKVRSAWISFAGRIVAQLVGAIATVALGVMVLHRYTSSDAQPPAARIEQERYGQPAASGPQPDPVHVIVITPSMLGLREANSQGWAPDRSCGPALDKPAPSTALLDNGTLLAR